MKTASATPHLALCESAASATAVGEAIALALAATGQAPEWAQLMPAGPDLKGRDGRAWKMADVAAVVAATQLPFALDYEHAMDLPSIKGVETIASGWCEELDIRDGQIWGRISWTPAAAKKKALPGNSEKFLAIARRVQLALTSYGYYDGAIDGVIGKKSRTALSKFQADYGLKVTGTITPEVLDAFGIQAQ